MGVYLPNMEMPTMPETIKQGENVPYIDVRIFADGNAVTSKGEKPYYTEYSVIEIPPHGRLIDADEVMLKIQEYIEEYGWETDEHGWHNEKWCAMKEAEMAIDNAPTVIPAEPPKEES